MKPILLLIAGLLLATPEARAQVIIHQDALDQLAGIVPQVAAPPVVSAPVAIRRLPRRIAYRHVLPKSPGSRPRIAAVMMPVKPAMPPHPAVQPVVAKPVIVAPVVPVPQLPRPAIIRFIAGAADLPGNVAATLKPFCAPGGIITIDAYAAGDPGDPSAGPRLSMQRAFAIRDALTACGVPSADIIPRANGTAAVQDPNAAQISAGRAGQ